VVLFAQPFAAADGACGWVRGVKFYGNEGVLGAALVVLHVFVQQVVGGSKDAVVGHTGEETDDVLIVDF
jgi:hypothetical protein